MLTKQEKKWLEERKHRKAPCGRVTPQAWEEVLNNAQEERGCLSPRS